VQNCTATAAADLVKDGFTASAAWALVTEFLTYVCTALKEATALSCTDMFSFEHVIDGPGCRMKGSLLALSTLTLRSLALTSATSLIAGMAATV
jgi:hypothetical protein